MEIRNAIFSACRRYRYALSILWDAGLSPCLFVMLNPSTADEFVDDPTIRRVKSFARNAGYGGVWIGNLFAWRATDPRELKKCDDPIGPANDEALRWMADSTRMRVYAWGAEPFAIARAGYVKALLGDVRPRHLGLTKAGHPRHPLYLRSDTTFQLFEVRR